MWDKQRRIRDDSRKRAMRAARARAGHRSGAPEAPGPASETESEPHAPANPPEPEAPEPETAQATPEEPHDRASSLAWIGLILLTLILGAFLLALLFMLG